MSSIAGSFRVRQLVSSFIRRKSIVLLTLLSFCLFALPSIAQCRVGISTNLLYDAVLVPNFGAEVWMGRHVSIKADYMWAWWSKDSRHRYWRIEGGDIEPRLWLSSARSGRTAGTGHHIGVYGGMVTYDIEFGGKGWQAPRWSWHTGVSYGYAAPIGKSLTLDFNIGIGYHWGKYYEYKPGNDDGKYWWTATKQRKWIGPTRAEVSLVWHLGKSMSKKRYYVQKGGLR